MTNEEKLYDRYEKLIYKQAWKWAQKTGREFKDLLSVCNEAFMECTCKFQPERAKFSTLLVRSCSNRIIDYLRKFDMPTEEEQKEESILTASNCTSRSIKLIELKDELSAEGRELVEVVLESTAEIFESVSLQGASRQAIRRVVKNMMWEKGWTDYKISLAFSEVEQTLSKVYN